MYANVQRFTHGHNQGYHGIRLYTNVRFLFRSGKENGDGIFLLIWAAIYKRETVGIRRQLEVGRICGREGAW